MNNIYKVVLGLAVILVAGVFFFFYRFYDHDVKALEDFSTAYERFDQAMADISNPVLPSNPANTPAIDDLMRKADEALVELKLKANARISSIIKNEKEIMKTTLEVADLSEKELDSLKATQRAAADRNADLNRLAKELGDLTNQRKTAYARFREFGELKD